MTWQEKVKWHLLTPQGILLCLGILAGLCGSIWYNIGQRERIGYLREWEYAWAMRTFDGMYMDAFRRTYGEPEADTRWTRYDGIECARLDYDGFSLYCTNTGGEKGNSDSLYITEIEVRSKRYRFGWRRIGVGSTREQVERAFSEKKRLTNNYNLLALGLRADICYLTEFWRHILFYFDENDCVERIIIKDRIK